ncbi:XRE family transcriptional regulator [Vibrio anguillarum]|uniref:XRE family transcriptional regulator n=4 Tax=Vibrio anguillarum TaxID=55601 RepID=A0A289GDN7_VIBAN|nr:MULTISPECIES: helix-turn-helix transcriptional regulator [Vibrio]ASW81501.1 XRE family transcriptional regulator [Vibrio anguillarum]ASW83193.1 XRE family transcriptional regulator [Vibrio anguillarum]AZS24070.1 XRE family transcriptional regulator [Vibrio anguillarum]AZS27369.1 XRE family transcriptional regulator [Vibrio anguillarum]MBF4285054.1 XRE family transcriptional regulator [Vibrio anguillarum]
MSFDNPIPIRLKEARKKAKLSQKMLGVRIGMDESSASPRMNQYEKGKHTPDVHTLKLIADELGVPLNYFFCEDEESAELVVAISKLSIEKRRQLLQFIANMPEDAPLPK